MAGGITSEPLNPQSAFNWIFLVELLVCGILTVFFLFYFNRLFATLVSYGIRAYTWHNYHAYIDIQALQISLLGGRIFFKDIRYHGHNETIFIHGGYITWRYWLRKVKDAELYTNPRVASSEDGSDTPTSGASSRNGRNRNLDKAEKGGIENKKSLPCRISVKVSGVEAFMYNRTPAYDGIIDAVLRAEQKDTHDRSQNPEGKATGSVHSTSMSGSVDDVDVSGEKPHGRLRKNRPHGSNGTNEVGETENERKLTRDLRPAEPPAFLRLLPIHVDCNKGAIVVGNENTPAVITAQFEKASGEFDAAPAGSLDSYQQVFNFQFTHPVVHMKPNDDFKSLQLEAAARIKTEAQADGELGDSLTKEKPGPKKRQSWGGLWSLSTLFAKSTDSVTAHSKSNAGTGGKAHAPQVSFPGRDEWKGLSRYLDDGEQDGHDEWSAVEYAKTSLIADCPCINISFYWDIPGPVPSDMGSGTDFQANAKHDVNGGPPPEYGMDIQIFGGLINYGPWADRHRGIFQSVFFPGSRVDGVPATPLSPGDTRMLSIFKLFLSIEDDTVLRIPIREPSKDWKWKGKAHNVASSKKQTEKPKGKGRPRKKSIRDKHRDKGAPGPNVRPFAWFDIKVTANSSVSYKMDMVASKSGYGNKLGVDLHGTEISSSVNHGLLWRSGTVALDCDLSNPLSWNSLRKWAFDISCRDLELFLLRDHMFLLVDLVADWGTGPPPDYFTFVPFQYLLNIHFYNFKLFINTNESNIVNNPADLDDNNFILLFGEQLHGNLTIPLDRYRPLLNEISFDVGGQDLGLDLCMPSKSTLNTFVQNKQVAQLGALTIKGSHTYMTETSSANTDRLYLEIHGSRLALELYGFLIRHFMKIKDNYFGEDMHFKTLEEFQELPSRAAIAEGAPRPDQHVNKSNDLDVILCVIAEDATVLIPANIYSTESSVRIDLPSASADLRFTNYYMDLTANFSPLSLSLAASSLSQGIPLDTTGHTELFVDSIDIYGHRLFGLPPTEPTYVCCWDFNVGKVSGECSSEFVRKAVGAARGFAFTLDDDENALPIPPLPIHDSTFLRLKTNDIHVWIHIATEALLFSTGPVTVDFNDLASSTFSQRLKVLVPDLTIGCVDAQSASRHRTRAGEKQTVKTHAFLQTTLSFNMLKRKLGFTADLKAQQSHMQEQDQRTHRTPFLFTDDLASTSPITSVKPSPNVQPPAMQYPPLPHPVSFVSPDSEKSSLKSSEYSFYSGLPPRRSASSKRPPMRSSSLNSLATSIRSAHHPRLHKFESAPIPERTPLARTSSSRTRVESPYTLPSEEERGRRGLPRSSLALSSSLAPPYFPLDLTVPDLSDVPTLPNILAPMDDPVEDMPVFNDVSTKHLNEDFVHTSLILSAQHGIRIHCTPRAVRSAANMVDSILPRHPEDVLDDFQIGVMTHILDNQKRLQGKGKSNEFNIRVPYTHIRFNNEFASEIDEEMSIERDQYDLELDRLNVAARVKEFPGEQAGENTVAVHTTLRSLVMSIKEGSTASTDDVAIQLRVDEILFWMLKSKDMSVNVNFRGFQVATASKKVEYLASLIHRTTLLGQEFAAKFEELGSQQQARLRYLAWALTTSQAQLPDPAFISRPSYAMRATEGHLRSHDSWKIISRFRFVWQSLPDNEKAKIKQCCLHKRLQCPDDAEEHVIAMWDQWRTWDLAHVKKSYAMRTIYGSMVGIEQAQDDVPINVNIRSAGIKLIIDPGPNQSEAAMRIVAVNLALMPPMRPQGLMLMEEETAKTATVVHVNARDSIVRLNWEICELVMSLLKMFQNDTTERTTEEPATPHNLEKPKTASLKPQQEKELQVAFTTDNARLSLEGINIRSVFAGQGMRVSFIASEAPSPAKREEMGFFLHIDSGTMEMLTRSRLLLKSRTDQPSLYLSHVQISGAPDEIKVAGASRMITMEVMEDVLGIIEVVDLALRDEVSYLHQQTENFKTTLKHKAPVPKKPTTRLPNLSAALLMGGYSIELGLLQSLTWSISGSSGRLSVAPVTGTKGTLQIDYDLEAHKHKMYSSTIDGSHVITSLDLPPASGSVWASHNEKQTAIKVTGLIDVVVLQAAEIQGLLSTLNKPEISNVFHAIQHDLSVLEAHFHDIFPKEDKSSIVEQTPSTTEFMFGVHMTLAGLRILASAPGQLDRSTTAHLTFILGAVHLKAANISQDKSLLALPEISAQLQQISIEMTLSDRLGERRCGNVTLGALFHATAQKHSERTRRMYKVRSSELEVNVFAETASAVVDVMNHLQDRIKDLDLSKEKKYLKRLRHTRARAISKVKKDTASDQDADDSGALFTSSYSLELLNIHVSWIVGSSAIPAYPGTELENLVLSFRRIDLSTRKDDAARLMIEDMQLQMVPTSADREERSPNSALLPEVVFNVTYSSTKDTRQLAFQAAGKALDLRLESRFVLPANVIEQSIALAVKKFRAASATWNMTPTTTGAQRSSPFGNKRLSLLLVEADFAGAVVHLSERKHGTETKRASEDPKRNRTPRKGKYGQFVSEGSTNSTSLRAPGVALRVEYKDDGRDPSLNAELRIDGSNNILYPTVVPLIVDISNSIKEVVRNKDESDDTEKMQQSRSTVRLLDEENFITADPSALIGRTRLNLGLRICKQEFSLSCQPIARVAAVAKLEDIYLTVNSVKSQDHGHFFAVSAAFEKLQASVQHVYSRESTLGFDVDSIVLSMMNSKHLSGTSGISAILKINPTRLQINARQLQDFLLFREIWIPPEVRQSSKPPSNPPPSMDQSDYLIQRYQQVSAATAFPWNANVAIAEVFVDLDLGQAIGKTSLTVTNLWASSRKSSDWEQNLCIGIEKVGIESSGRTSGFVRLSGVKIRTSISWPSQAMGVRQTPLIQASAGFQQLRVKAGFDYQAFMIADITNFDFLMYNVREQLKGSKDRLVAILDGDKVHVFCTATSAAQGLALYQAIERLVQENQQAYAQSLKDIEKFLRRKSSVTPYRTPSQSMITSKLSDKDSTKAPISLHTDVVVTLRSINIGVFPSTFIDSQIFTLEASEAQARFAVALERGEIHSGLGMTLGQLSVSLASVSHPKKTKPIGDLTVEDVVTSARSARGGTILRVPKVKATMQTWQRPDDNKIDYLFKSLFEGKVDVGWNYSRISFIRTMWGNHSRSLASRLGKPLPESAVKITTSDQQAADSSSTKPASPSDQITPSEHSSEKSNTSEREKITAVVNVPQSRYEYFAREPPLIETPQLRDMGEATPPLEWIGLHRDRLPNVTHQIVIVTLLEVAKEVEDAYERILGSS